MKNVISLLFVGDDDVDILVLVQRVDHDQPHAFELELVASIHLVLRPLQPGAFVLFPFGRYVETSPGGCVFIIRNGFFHLSDRTAVAMTLLPDSACLLS